MGGVCGWFALGAEWNEWLGYAHLANFDAPKNLEMGK